MKSHLRIPHQACREEHGQALKLALKLAGLGDEKRCLMIGNSLTHFNIMPHMLEKLLSCCEDQPWLCSSVTRGGATLRWHRNMGYGESILESSPNFDVVVLQDQSRRPAQHPKDCEEDMVHLTEAALERGAVVVLYQTWNLRDEAPQLDLFKKTFEAVEARVKVDIARAGEVWERARLQFQDVELYRDDGKHPTALGSFLAAMVLCYTICGQLPAQAPNDLLAGGYEQLHLPQGYFEFLRETIPNI